MKKLQKLMDDIREWSDGTFGEAQRTIPILHHLKKEVPEAIEAVRQKEKVEHDASVGVGEFYRKSNKAALEFADCFMLILDAASHFGLSASDLLQVTKIKLEINKDRKWGKPDENGVVEHIK
jgi:NTP pyrophosphatase (non-canonical NTP hydrolase)